MSMRHSSRVFLAVAAGWLLFLASCESPLAPLGFESRNETVTSPEAEPKAGSPGLGLVFSSRSGFYPLQLGNRWHYSFRQTCRMEPYEGDPGHVFGGMGTLDRELVCKERVGDSDCLIERTVSIFKATWLPDAVTSYSWTGYRQDRGGLYALFSSKTPPSCDATAWANGGIKETGANSPESSIPKTASERLMQIEGAFGGHFTFPSFESRVLDGVVKPSEWLALKYPLHVGSTWFMDEWSSISATVEAIEVVNLRFGPVPAYRLRIDAGYIGPREFFYMWYGREGLLKSEEHLLADCIDPVCGPEVFCDASLVLDRVELASPGRW